MRTSLACLIFALVPVVSYADDGSSDSMSESSASTPRTLYKPTLGVGAVLGVGWVTVGGDDPRERVSPRLSNSFGLVLGFEPTRRWLVQLELLSIEKGNGANTKDRTFEANYFEGVLFGGFNIRTSHVLRPYVQLGVALGYLRKAVLFRDGEVPRDFTEALRRFDVGVVGALGVGWEPIPRHVFTFDVRLDVGLRSALSGVEHLNRALLFVIGFRYSLLDGGRWLVSVAQE